MRLDENMIALRKQGIQRRKSLTRCSNTGLDRQNSDLYLLSDSYSDEVKRKDVDGEISLFCDWITINGQLDETELTEFCFDIIGGEFFNEKLEIIEEKKNKSFYRGGVKYTKTIKNVFGVNMDVTPIQDDERYKVIVRLSGKAMGMLFRRNDLLGVASFLHYIDQLGMSISRYDNTISDPCKKLDITQVCEAILKKNYMYFRRAGTTTSSDSRKGVTGITLYLGSRQSECFYRLYDEYAKHKTVANRLEQELKDGKAKQVVNQLINYYNDYILATKKIDANMVQENYVCSQGDSVDQVTWKRFNNEISLYLKKILLGGLNFIDKSFKKANGSVKDCPVLEFWKDFKAYILSQNTPIKLNSRVFKPSIRKKGEWMYKSVKGTLGMIRRGLPPNDFIKCMRFLFLEDKYKKYPKAIEADREVLIEELKKTGIQALLDSEKIHKAREEYDIEFDTYQYEMINDSILLDNNDKVYGKGNTKLFDYLNARGEFVKELYQDFPLIIELLCNFLKYDEAEMIKSYCNNFSEEIKWDKKLFTASQLI